MSKLYLQEKIVGNPGQIVIINNNNQISLTAYKPALNKVIKVNGPANATIYASYLESSEDLVPLSIKGIVKYNYIFDCVGTNNVSSVSINLDTWMTTTYANNYQNVFTYTSGNWKNSNNDNVNLTNLGISYILSSGSNPTNGTKIIVTANYDKARYEIYPPNIGTWAVACTTSAGYSDKIIDVVADTNEYIIDLSIFQAYIQVNYTSGATCTLYNEENNYTMIAPNTSGSYIFKVPYAGIWKITVELEATSASTGQPFTKVKYDLVDVTTINQQVSRTVNVISSVLNECTWDEIKYIADNHLGPYYWSIGDCKAITLNGTLTSYFNFMNTTYYAFIIDFDHCIENNSSGIVETKLGGITFEIGRLAPDSSVDTMISESNPKQFPHDSGAYTSNIFMKASNDVYGWEDASVMHNILYTLYTSVLPDDLRSVIKSTNKYTDNLGYDASDGGWQSGAVTSTEELLFLLSPYEMDLAPFSSSGPYYNPDEENHQVKYPYYTALENASRKSKYRYVYSNFNGTYFNTWLRSPGKGTSYFTLTTQTNNQPVYGTHSGNYFTTTYDSPGICPCFVVGSEDPAS